MGCGCGVGVNLDDVFTANPKETPIHVTSWNTLGETWPYFRPNYKAMDEYRQDLGYDEVYAFPSLLIILLE